MTPAPLLYESHCHTPLCKHAFGEPDEYAAVALARGFKGITFTCHCPLPDGFSANVRMAPGQFDDYVGMIAATREAFAGGQRSFQLQSYPFHMTAENLAKTKRGVILINCARGGLADEAAVSAAERAIGMPATVSGTYSGEAAEFARALGNQHWLILASIVVILPTFILPPWN